MSHFSFTLARFMMAENDSRTSDFYSETEANFQELDFSDNQEQVVPMQGPETPESDGSSSGGWVIDLDARSQEDASPQVDQAANLMEDSSDSDDSEESEDSMDEPMDASGPLQTLQSVASAGLEASTSTRPNTLASKRSRANKKLRDDCNEHEASRLEARNHFLLCKIAKLESIRDQIRALVANRLAK